jgi:hypothetical protein
VATAPRRAATTIRARKNDLAASLPGHEAYRQKVRHRLMPPLW